MSLITARPPGPAPAPPPDYDERGGLALACVEALIVGTFAG